MLKIGCLWYSIALALHNPTTENTPPVQPFPNSVSERAVKQPPVSIIDEEQWKLGNVF